MSLKWANEEYAYAMQIKITGKNLDVGEALRGRIDERLRQFQQKYFEGSVHGHVTVEKQRAAFHTDCTLHLATGLVLSVVLMGVAANLVARLLERYRWDPRHVAVLIACYWLLPGIVWFGTRYWWDK